MKKNLLRFSLLWVLFFCVFFLLSAAMQVSLTSAAPTGDMSDSERYPEISFATTPGFYTDSISVFFDGAENCDIYYTTNGVVPESTELKGSIRRYSPEAGISLRAYAGKIRYYSVTARAHYPDGSWGDPVCSTYVVGEGADTRFTTMSVFITCDPDKLFGYEEGILVLGQSPFPPPTITSADGNPSERSTWNSSIWMAIRSSISRQASAYPVPIPVPSF